MSRQYFRNSSGADRQTAERDVAVEVQGARRLGPPAVNRRSFLEGLSLLGARRHKKRDVSRLYKRTDTDTHVNDLQLKNSFLQARSTTLLKYKKELLHCNQCEQWIKRYRVYVSLEGCSGTLA